MSELHADADLIDKLGGPAALARSLGYTGKGAVQRVQNWKYRGIPPLLRYQRPDVFGPPPANEEEIPPSRCSKAA